MTSVPFVSSRDASSQYGEQEKDLEISLEEQLKTSRPVILGTIGLKDAVTIGLIEVAGAMPLSYQSAYILYITY
jgi:hypothetical protein